MQYDIKNVFWGKSFTLLKKYYILKANIKNNLHKLCSFASMAKKIWIYQKIPFFSFHPFGWAFSSFPKPVEQTFLDFSYCSLSAYFLQSFVFFCFFTLHCIGVQNLVKNVHKTNCTCCDYLFLKEWLIFEYKAHLKCRVCLHIQLT